MYNVHKRLDVLFIYLFWYLPFLTSFFSVVFHFFFISFPLALSRAVCLFGCCYAFNIEKEEMCLHAAKKNELNVFRMCLMKMIICIFHEHVIWYYSFNVLFLLVSLFLLLFHLKSAKKSNELSVKHIRLWITFIFHHQILVSRVRSRTHDQLRAYSMLINSA